MKSRRGTFFFFKDGKVSRAESKRDWEEIKDVKEHRKGNKWWFNFPQEVGEMVFRTQVNWGYLLLWNKRHGGKNGSRCSGVYDLGWRKLEFDLVVLLFLVKDWLPFESDVWTGRAGALRCQWSLVPQCRCFTETGDTSVLRLQPACGRQPSAARLWEQGQVRLAQAQALPLDAITCVLCCFRRYQSVLEFVTEKT